MFRHTKFNLGYLISVFWLLQNHVIIAVSYAFLKENEVLPDGAEVFRILGG